MTIMMDAHPRAAVDAEAGEFRMETLSDGMQMIIAVDANGKEYELFYVPSARESGSPGLGRTPESGRRPPRIPIATSQ